MALHLWWWEEDHAPGETAEDARRRLSELTGVPVEECGELDEWMMIADDELMRDEDGSIAMPAQSAAEYAAEMARAWARAEVDPRQLAIPGTTEGA